MDFTPRKQVTSASRTGSMVRHNPYSSGGQTFIHRFKKRPGSSSTPQATVPRPLSKSTPRTFSRTDKIINNSFSSTWRNGEHSSRGKWAGKKTPPQGAKRPFSAVNGVSNSDDPYDLVGSDSEDFLIKKKTSGSAEKDVNSSSDSDLEIFKRTSRDNKENSIFSPERCRIDMRTYLKKKKVVPRSRLVYDVSPEKNKEIFESRKKVLSEKESNTCAIRSESDNENCDKQSTSKTEDKEKAIFSPPKQTKESEYFYGRKKNSGTSTSLDLSKSPILHDFSPEKIQKAYGHLLTTAEKENVPTEVKEPTTEVTLPHLIGFPNYGNTCYMNSVLQALFGLPPFVSDYQVLSSQLSMPSISLSHGLIQVLTSRAKGQISGVKLALRTVKENLVRVDGSFSGFKMQDANEFLTRILDTTKDEVDRRHMNTPSPDRVQEQEPVFLHSGQDAVDEDVTLSGHRSMLNEVPKDVEVEGDIVSAFAHANISTPNVTDKPQVEVETSSITSSRTGESSDAKLTAAPQISPCKRPVVSMSRNPVKDNFEFQLLESYRCLGCGEVEGRKQEYFGLYVNLPEEGGESIQDAITAYMSADQRELKCAKCDHNQSSVVTSITRLPRVLIIQLKRYEYKADLGESIKRSSRVHVNRWLTLDSHMPNDVAPPSSWDPSGSSLATPRAPKQATLTVRNLSSELNVCEGNKDEDDLPDLNSPAKTSGATTVATSAEKEEEELQEVMRRSMDDVGGTQEEDEIQQAIRLSLQDLGMNYIQENQAEGQDDDESIKVPQTKDEEAQHDSHAYRLISIISHFGRTTNTGHYVADVYNCDEDTWQHYDDDCVSKIPESVVFAEGRQKNGYIFFYIHKNLLQKIGGKSSLPQR